MELYQNTLFGLRYKYWTCLEAVAYFAKGVARELKIAPVFFANIYIKFAFRSIKKKWLKKVEGESYFDFKGAKLPDISNSPEKKTGLASIFEDTFLFPCFYNDKYDKTVVDFMDKHLPEGPYGYTDGKFDVTVKKDDIVIDAGAWIGDFSAYAASKGAITYAFEPVAGTFRFLCKTKDLNEQQIYPIQKGLSDKECEMNISINENGSGSNSIVAGKENTISEKVFITTLDKFVKENNIEKVDFIKADIEGAERDLLKGAANTLKTFAPKLAICTYHLPDDPEVLEKLILDANPNYTIRHLSHKLFAAVINIM